MVISNLDDAQIVGENIGRFYLKNPTLFKVLLAIYLLFFLFLVIRFW